MNTGKEACRVLPITVAAGTGTGTLTNEWTLTRWIRVIPVGETDTYDVTLKDNDGHIMMKRTGQTGTTSENLQVSLGILKTVVIENASQNGTFYCKFDLH